MTLLDGPTLLGIAAIITSISGLVTALRRTANRQTLDQPGTPSDDLRRTRREPGVVDDGGQGG